MTSVNTGARGFGPGVAGGLAGRVCHTVGFAAAILNLVPPVVFSTRVGLGLGWAATYCSGDVPAGVLVRISSAVRGASKVLTAADAAPPSCCGGSGGLSVSKVLTAADAVPCAAVHLEVPYSSP